jgi:hypothetical protein
MPPVLTIDTLDLSSMLRMQHDEGFDPVGDPLDPQFVGNPAFTEGVTWVADANNAREWTVPLLVKGVDRTAIHTTVRQINQAIKRGAQVAFATDSADPLTYFDLERGKLVQKYEFFLARSNVMRMDLHLWTAPFGHTGTVRSIASALLGQATSFLATGVQGDVAAGMDLSISPASSPNAVSMIAYAVKYPAPSGFQAVIPAASVAVSGLFGATLRGASGRTASQYRDIIASGAAAGNFGRFLDIPLPADAYGGRYRLLALMNQRIPSGHPSSVLNLVSNWALNGPSSGYNIFFQTQLASQSGVGPSAFGMYDLGEYTVPTMVGASPSIQMQLINFVDPFFVGVPAIDAFFLLSLDTEVGVFAGTSMQQLTSTPQTYEISQPSKFAMRFQGTIPAADITGSLRGAYPKLPAVGSPGASGPAQVLVIAPAQASSATMSANDVLGNNPFTVNLGVRERFRYMR